MISSIILLSMDQYQWPENLKFQTLNQYHCWIRQQKYLPYKLKQYIVRVQLLTKKANQVQQISNNESQIIQIKQQIIEIPKLSKLQYLQNQRGISSQNCFLDALEILLNILRKYPNKNEQTLQSIINCMILILTYHKQPQKRQKNKQRQLYLQLFLTISKYITYRTLLLLIKLASIGYNKLKHNLKDIQILFQMIIKCQFKIKCINKLSMFIQYMQIFIVSTQWQSNSLYIVAMLKIIAKKNIDIKPMQQNIRIKIILQLIRNTTINFSIFKDDYLHQSTFNSLLEILLQKDSHHEEVYSLIQKILTIKVTVGVIKIMIKKLQIRSQRLKSGKNLSLLDENNEQQENNVFNGDQQIIIQHNWKDVFKLMEKSLQLYPQPYDFVKFKHPSATLLRYQQKQKNQNKNWIPNPSIFQLKIRTLGDQQQYLLATLFGHNNQRQYWLMIQESQFCTISLLEVQNGIIWNKIKQQNVRWNNIWKNKIWIIIQKDNLSILINCDPRRYNQESIISSQQKIKLDIKNIQIMGIAIGGGPISTSIDQLYQFKYYPGLKLKNLLADTNNNLCIDLLKSQYIPLIKQLNKQSKIEQQLTVYLNHPQLLHNYQKSFIAILESLGNLDLFFLVNSHIIKKVRKNQEQLVMMIRQIMIFFSKFVQVKGVKQVKLTPKQQKMRVSNVLSLCWLVSKEQGQGGTKVIRQLLKLLGIRGGITLQQFQIDNKLDVLCNFGFWNSLPILQQKQILKDITNLLNQCILNFKMLKTTKSQKKKQKLQKIKIIKQQSYIDLSLKYCGRLLLQNILFYNNRSYENKKNQIIPLNIVTMQQSFFQLIYQHLNNIIKEIVQFPRTPSQRQNTSSYDNLFKVFQFIKFMLQVLVNLSGKNNQFYDLNLALKLSEILKKISNIIFLKFLQSNNYTNYTELLIDYEMKEQQYRQIKQTNNSPIKIETQTKRYQIKGQAIHNPLSVQQLHSVTLFTKIIIQMNLQQNNTQDIQNLQTKSNFKKDDEAQIQNNLAYFIVYIQSLNVLSYKSLIYKLPIDKYTTSLYEAIWNIHISKIYLNKNYDFKKQTHSQYFLNLFKFLTNQQFSQISVSPIILQAIMKHYLINQDLINIPPKFLSSSRDQNPQSIVEVISKILQEYFNQKITELSINIIFMKIHQIIAHNQNIRYLHMNYILSSMQKYTYKHTQILKSLLSIRQLLYYRTITEPNILYDVFLIERTDEKIKDIDDNTNQQRNSSSFINGIKKKNLISLRDICKLLIEFINQHHIINAIKNLNKCDTNDVEAYRYNISLNIQCILDNITKNQIQRNKVLKEQSNQDIDLMGINKIYHQKIVGVLTQFQHFLKIQLLPLIKYTTSEILKTKNQQTKQIKNQRSIRKRSFNCSISLDQERQIAIRIVKDFIIERRRSLLQVQQIWREVQANNHYFWQIFISRKPSYILDFYATPLKNHPLIKIQTKRPIFQLPKLPFRKSQATGSIIEGEQITQYGDDQSDHSIYHDEAKLYNKTSQYLQDSYNNKDSQINIKNKVFMITITKIFYGNLTFTSNQIKFQQYFSGSSSKKYDLICANAEQRRTLEELEKDKKIITIPINKNTTIMKKKYLFHDCALQIYSATKNMTYFFCFTGHGKKKRQKFIEFYYNKIIHKISQLSSFHKLSNKEKIQYYCREWKNGKISNYEYLMHLNDCAGRTFNDLSQYYIFPWTLSDFKSSSIDLENQHIYRDISKPMGMVCPQRWKQFISRYETSIYLYQDKKYLQTTASTEAKKQESFIFPPQLKKQSLDKSDICAYKKNPFNTPFLYGSFYSNPAIVCNYLIRVDPFTKHHYMLQSKRFDNADRLFYSINQQYNSSLTNISDVKELIPQFYSNWQFLINRSKYDLGRKQNKDMVNDVILPQWVLKNSKRPQQFIFRMRQALQSQYITKGINKWIDLIFGIKNKQENGFQNSNLFSSTVYGSNLSTADQNQKQSLLMCYKQFGQNPDCLFDNLHPQFQDKKLFKHHDLDLSILYILKEYPRKQENQNKNQTTASKLFQKSFIQASSILNQNILIDQNNIYILSQSGNFLVVNQKQRKQLNGSILKSLFSWKKSQNNDNKQLSLHYYQLQRPKSKKSEAIHQQNLFLALQNKQSNFKSFTVMNFDQKNQNWKFIIYLENGKVYYRELEYNYQLSIEKIFLDDYYYQIIRICRNYLLIVQGNNIHIFSPRQKNSKDKQINTKSKSPGKSFYRKSLEKQYVFDIIPQFTQHQATITHIQVSNILSICVSLDLNNKIFILNISEKIYVRYSFLLSDLFLSEKVERLLLHEMGLIILWTSMERILVYNLLGDLVIKSYIFCANERITCLTIFSHQRSDLIFGTDHGNIFITSIFDLVNGSTTSFYCRNPKPYTIKQKANKYTVVEDDNAQKKNQKSKIRLLSLCKEPIVKILCQNIGRHWQIVVCGQNQSLYVIRSVNFTTIKNNTQD